MKGKFSKYSDNELVRILKNENKKDSDLAFAEIYDRYGIRINAYIRTILGDRILAEDVFQETFIKFYQNVKVDFYTGTIYGFIIRIARNLCLNAKRDSKNNISIDDIDLPMMDNQSLENKEMSDILLTAIDLIEGDYREALVLRYLNEQPYEEIASVLNVTQARARYLVFTAKNKLREILTPYMNEMINK